MHTKLKKICCFSCVIAFGIMISGCGNQEKEVPEAKVVKAFKIEKKQKKDALTVEAVSKKGVEGSLSVDEETQKKSEQNEVLLSTEKPDTNIEQQSDETTELPAIAQQPDETTELPAIAQQPETTELPTDKTDPINESIVVDLSEPDGDDEDSSYNPEGRVDPFAPLFRPAAVTIVKTTDAPQSAREARLGRLTALEKLDISQLKLTGIMYLSAADRRMAMVEETTGKGHVIKKGTYIGVNSGRVVEIKENVVTIEEEVENYMGDIVVRKRELKLQKPLGEG